MQSQQAQMKQKPLLRIGNFKVAYWNPSSASIMNSKMFDTYEQATAFTNKVTQNGMIYTLMKKQNASKGSYTWKVLDDGVGRYLSPLSQAWKYRKQIMYGTAGIVLWRLIFK